MYRKKHIDMNFIVCIGAVLGGTVRIPWLPKKRSPTHPGEMLLKDFLEPLGVSQKEFAKHLGWTYARLNEIINGRRNVCRFCVRPG